MDETDFRAIVEQLPLVVYVDALDERSTPHLRELADREPARLHRPRSGRPIRICTSARSTPDDRERMLAEIERRNHGELASESHDYRLFARDGSVVWVRDEEVVVHDASGSARPRRRATSRTSPSASTRACAWSSSAVLETATAGVDPDARSLANVVEHPRRSLLGHVRVTYRDDLRREPRVRCTRATGDERALALH